MEAYKLILASSSEIRKQILTNHKVNFKAVKHVFDENIGKTNNNLKPTELSLYLAVQLAYSTACVGVLLSFSKVDFYVCETLIKLS